MTDPEIILLMVKCIPILLAVFIFLHLLCDEYVRALERLGVLGPRPSDGQSGKPAPAPRDRGVWGRPRGPVSPRGVLRRRTT
jgi:hypothetical protein